jgi:hypothetical protein
MIIVCGNVVTEMTHMFIQGIIEDQTPSRRGFLVLGPCLHQQDTVIIDVWTGPHRILHQAADMAFICSIAHRGGNLTVVLTLR